MVVLGGDTSNAAETWTNFEDRIESKSWDAADAGSPDSGGGRDIAVVVVDTSDGALRADDRLVLRHRRLWQTVELIVVKGVEEPFAHGIALEIAQLNSGEITVDVAPDAGCFAWIEVPPTVPQPAPIAYPDMTGSLPAGMHVPAPTGVANDYGFIQERFHRQPTPDMAMSVVIPLYNRREMLAKTLSCLVHQTYPADLFEVVIADDGSRDNPLEVVESFSDRLDISYVRQEDRGYRLSEVRNLGIRAARQENIVLLDCDMAPVPQLVEIYARWLASSQDAVFLGHRRYVDASGVSIEELHANPSPMLRLPDIVTGNPLEIDDSGGAPTIDWRVPTYQRTHNLRYDEHPFRMVCGGNIAFHRSVVDRAGGFDEEFTAWGAEDAEWGFRVWNRGVYIVPAFGACGLHQEPPGGSNETDREVGRQQTHPMFVERCPVPYRTEREDHVVHKVPLVSIYMPAYNAQDTIVEAVQSALDQTITDLEVCVVDDGSSDRTLEILEATFGDEPRVRWKSTQNRGIGAASNEAVRMCRGVFIGQLDADDLLRPNAVKFVLGLVERDTRYGLGYGGFQYIDGSGTITKQGSHHPEFSREALLLSMIVHPFRLFRARDWHRTPGFDEQLLNAVDYDMYLKLAEVTEVIHEKKITYQYRQSGSSTSVKDRKSQDKNNLAVVRASLERMGLAQDWQITTPDPTLPRKVVFSRRSAQALFAADIKRVSLRIVVEGPLHGRSDATIIDQLRVLRPTWEWKSDTQPGASRFRIIGPRLRKTQAEQHRFALKAAIDIADEMSFWLYEADPFSGPESDRTDRPIGGGGYVAPADPTAKTLLLGVTTLNRVDYLRHFLRSFNKTRSDDYRWIVVVADDGSTDETRAWLLEEARVNAELIVIENKNQTISGQTNSIFNAALATDFDIGFKCDDDIFFERPGWDKLYVDAVEASGRGHLVYHSVDYKAGDHEISDGPLTSSVEAPHCMGCFYTFTRDVLETTGYLDERSFPVRGHAHIDFTMRACRLGHNEVDTLFDATDSEDFIDLWSGPDYKQTFDWGGDAARALTDPAEKERRWSIVRDETRRHVPERPLDPLRAHSLIHTSPSLLEAGKELDLHPLMSLANRPVSQIDRANVLNMDGFAHHFAVTYEMARRHGLRVERFPGVDGSRPEIVKEWEEYSAEGLIRPHEGFMGRKLISSSGAWAYLSGMRAMIEQAKADRIKKLLVFDDDVMLSKDFGRRFPEFLDQLPSRWVLALLGWTSHGQSHFSRYEEGLLQVDAEFNGSYAFVVDSDAYDLLLHEIDARVWPFDSGPLRAVAQAFPEDSFAPETALAIADVRYSRIRGQRSHREFWKKMGHDPRQYEPRRFALHKGSTAPDDRSASRLSMLYTTGASVWDTIADVRSMLDQRAGNIEVVLGGSGSDADREVLERFAVRDPRLLIEWEAGASRRRLLQRAFDRSTGELVSMIAPGHRIDEQFAHDRISTFLESGAPMIESDPNWIAGPRRLLAEHYESLDAFEDEKDEQTR